VQIISLVASQLKLGVEWNPSELEYISLKLRNPSTVSFDPGPGFGRVGRRGKMIDICVTPFDRHLFLARLNRPDNLDLEIGPVLLD